MAIALQGRMKTPLISKSVIQMFLIALLAPSLLTGCKSSSGSGATATPPPPPPAPNPEEEERKRQERLAQQAERERRQREADEAKKERQRQAEVAAAEAQRIADEKARAPERARAKVSALEADCKERIGVAFKVENNYSSIEVSLAIIPSALLANPPTQLQILKGMDEMITAYKEAAKGDVGESKEKEYGMKANLLSLLALRQWKEYALPLIKIAEKDLSESGIHLETYSYLDQDEFLSREVGHEVLLDPTFLAKDAEESEWQKRTMTAAIAIFTNIDVLSDYEKKFVSSDRPTRSFNFNYNNSTSEEGYDIKTLRRRAAKLKEVLAAMAAKDVDEVKTSIAQSELDYLLKRLEKLAKDLSKEGIKFKQAAEKWEVDDEFFKQTLRDRAPQTLDKFKVMVAAKEFRNTALLAIVRATYLKQSQDNDALLVRLSEQTALLKGL